jgi:sugar lactone lactonase YvrE
MPRLHFPLRSLALPSALRSALLLVLLIASGSPTANAGEVLYLTEGNQLHRIDLAALREGRLVDEIVIERASLGDEREPRPLEGARRDVNGMICRVADGQPGAGRLIMGEDTSQPGRTPGWGVFTPDGTQVGRLTPTFFSKLGEPFGCAFHPDGRLFTVDIGDPGLLPTNGQLLVWLPPLGDPVAAEQSESRRYCKLASDLGTPGAVLVDGEGRVYVASSGRAAVLRFSPPFPTAPEAEGGCGGRDALGSPQADRVDREVLIRAPATFSGLAFSPRGTLYAASVATGRIYEYDLDGAWLRTILEPPEWWPPFSTGHPQGIAVDSEGTLYYADLDLVRKGFTARPGPDGKLRRIRFDAAGQPLPPETLLDGLAFPDGVAVYDE